MEATMEGECEELIEIRPGTELERFEAKGEEKSGSDRVMTVVGITD